MLGHLCHLEKRHHVLFCLFRKAENTNAFVTASYRLESSQFQNSRNLTKFGIDAHFGAAAGGPEASIGAGFCQTSGIQTLG